MALLWLFFLSITLASSQSFEKAWQGSYVRKGVEYDFYLNLSKYSNRHHFDGIMILQLKATGNSSKLINKVGNYAISYVKATLNEETNTFTVRTPEIDDPFKIAEPEKFIFQVKKNKIKGEVGALYGKSLDGILKGDVSSLNKVEALRQAGCDLDKVDAEIIEVGDVSGDGVLSPGEEGYIYFRIRNLNPYFELPPQWKVNCKADEVINLQEHYTSHKSNIAFSERRPVPVAHNVNMDFRIPTLDNPRGLGQWPLLMRYRINEIAKEGYRFYSLRYSYDSFEKELLRIEIPISFTSNIEEEAADLAEKAKSIAGIYIQNGAMMILFQDSTFNVSTQRRNVANGRWKLLKSLAGIFTPPTNTSRGTLGYVIEFETDAVIKEEDFSLFKELGVNVWTIWNNRLSDIKKLTLTGHFFLRVSDSYAPPSEIVQFLAAKFAGHSWECLAPGTESDRLQYIFREDFSFISRHQFADGRKTAFDIGEWGIGWERTPSGEMQYNIFTFNRDNEYPRRYDILSSLTEKDTLNMVERSFRYAGDETSEPFKMWQDDTIEFKYNVIKLGEVESRRLLLNILTGEALKIMEESNSKQKGECYRCQGFGAVPGEGVRCHVCHGTGKY